jgi:hypothetical protein
MNNTNKVLAVCGVVVVIVLILGFFHYLKTHPKSTLGTSSTPVGTTGSGTPPSGNSTSGSGSLASGASGYLDGTDATGHVYNQPTDWTAAAGTWNAKWAHYNIATQKLVFDSYRLDIQGGSTYSGSIKAADVNEYFQAGPNTGSVSSAGTRVLYVANEDGSDPTCIGCQDVTDGQNGVQIYQVAPSTSATPNSLVEQKGFTVYANQNKDIASWTPDGQWIIASVEMPKHPFTHVIGESSLGLYNNLWAISANGKTWVQLTDYENTWQYADPVASIAFQCSDTKNCSVGCQYATASNDIPYGAYTCSAPNQPPPAVGLMRAAVGNVETSDMVPVAFAERVGVDSSYTWLGPLQVAIANIDLSSGMPALVDYQRNFTPTPSNPSGAGLWSNPNGTTKIAISYETWGFSQDDSVLGLASDVFLSTSKSGVQQPFTEHSDLFADVVGWKWQSPQSLTDLSAYSSLYAYPPNAAPAPYNTWGYWEEPLVYSVNAPGPQFFAFGSSADLNPPWNPDGGSSSHTFGLETWIEPTDGSKAATKITNFSSPGAPMEAVPTSYDPNTNSLILMVANPNGSIPDPPGSVYRLTVPQQDL